MADGTGGMLVGKEATAGMTASREKQGGILDAVFRTRGIFRWISTAY
jgi:hypothetical protein